MNWHALTAAERRRLTRLEAVAEGMTDISWSSAKAKRVAAAAAKAGYAAMVAVIEHQYTIEENKAQRSGRR